MRTPNTTSNAFSNNQVNSNQANQSQESNMRPQSVSAQAKAPNSNSPIMKEVGLHEEDGAYLEIKYTLRRAPEKSKSALCTLIGVSKPAGNISANKKDGSYFMHSWLRPLVWNQGAQIDTETGELARTEVNVSLLRKSSTQLDPQLAAIVEAVKKNPESGALLLSMLPAASQETVKAALTNGQGWQRKKANVKVLLEKLFGHQSVRIKASLYGEFLSFADYISNIDWCDDEGRTKDYSLIIRFPLVESLNSSSELKEMYDAANNCAYFVPGTTSPIVYQEVSVYPTYMAVVRGAERVKDLTKMVSTERVMAAFEAAWSESDETKKVFLSNASLDRKADRVNEWKAQIAAKTGKKWADTFKDQLFDLASEVANNNAVAAKEAADILASLQQLAAEGTHPRCDKAEADKFAAAFSKRVEEAKTAPAQPAVTPSPVVSQSTAPTVSDVEDVADDFAAPQEVETDWSAILGGEFLDGILTEGDDE